MRILYRDCEKAFNKFTYIEEQNVFLIEDDEHKAIEYHPILSLDATYNPAKFGWRRYYNYSKSHAESSIYQVFVGEQRIGWVFPIQALLSAEHDCSNNPYFLRYAYVATRFLLDNVNRVFDYMPDEFRLDDVFNDVAECILVYDKENCGKLEHFDLDEYTVGLFKYGYSVTASDVDTCIDLGNLEGEKRTCLRIKPIAQEFRDETYIKLLFEKQLPIEKNEIVRFHFIYQIVEILIGIVFDHHFKRIISEMGSSGANLFELKDLITKEAGEKHRIIQLFSEFVVGIGSDYKSELNEACIGFLDCNNIKFKDDFIQNLYDARCFLVHRLYSFDPKTIELLSYVNQAFLALIIEVLCAFKMPESKAETTPLRE